MVFYNKMATDKSWKSINTVLTEVLSKSSLKKAEVSSIMESWKSRKEDITELFSVKTSKKKQKDPNQPKKAKTAYLFFSAEKRGEVKKNNPDLSNKEIMTELGQMWSSLSKEDKKEFEEKATEDKERYAREYEEYSSSPDFEGVKREKKAPKQKKARNAYVIYCQEMRNQVKADNPEMKGKEISSELSAMWKALSDEEKAPFQKRQAEEKASMEGGTIPEGDEEEAPVKKPSKAKAPTKAPAKAPTKAPAKAPTKAEAKAAAKAPTKAEAKAPTKAPTKAPAKSTKKATPGFECFREEQNDEIQSDNPDWTDKKVLAEITKRWGDLTEEDRQAYETEAQESEGEEQELSE